MSKTPKKPKFDRTVHYTPEEMERYLGALSETYNENLKVISEGSIATNIRLDRMDERFERVEHTLDSHTEMIGVLMEDVSVLKSDVSTLKSDMKEVKNDLKVKVDHAEFRPLVKRVERLEARR